MSPERAERSYRLEPLDSSGIFLGLGLVQCSLLGGGIALSVAILTAGAPLPLAGVPVLVAAAASFSRIGGHATWEWVPLLTGWASARLRRGRHWDAPLPLWASAETPAPMPPCLDGLDIVGIDWRPDVSLGAVRDRLRHTLTAVVPVSGPQFVVEPRGEQERLLAGWGDLLGQYAVERGVVSHLSWSDLAQPSGMGDHIAWLVSDERGIPNDTAAASYRELLDVGTDSAINHEAVVTITVNRERLSRHRALRGGVDEQLRRALVTSVEALLRGLRSADLAAADPLRPSGLQRLVRSRIDPVGARPRPRKGRLVERLALVRSSTAGPLALDCEWRHLRVDGAFHRTWWVGTWPRLAVPPAWLEPFLSGGGVTRSMTVYFQPVSTHQSRRRIERDLVKLESDAVTKEEKGRRIDARHRRATQALLDREEELVAGYPEMGYAGLVTVSARSVDDLDEHSEIIEQLARESGMDLRVLDARQDLGWAAALPLGLAPSTLLAS
ncbi:SCO6880 family protein [Iamia majanohamensis]|uniref:SCO6880 family protein n=1 Tax=Iamia majanohamensis TaxID=467976 RepID=UPI00300ED103